MDMATALSTAAACLLVLPALAVLLGVAVTARRDRRQDRAVAAVLAEFRAAQSPPPRNPGGPGGGGGAAAEPEPLPQPSRPEARILPFPTRTPATPPTRRAG